MTSHLEAPAAVGAVQAPAMGDELLIARPPSPIRPFLAGTLVGGVAGALVGTALSPLARGFFVGLYQLISRRLASSERDRLRFELLLQ